ncbi:hypothetical protein [Endozoicomonas numazuensis]|uniref:hypothetical protein n=1 Tax=Endozoicomonas numazuensis TaxID=1137799 RepID=UPI0012681A69|nr:hypothetical protein [Endozoicomonas numazuensis]
MAVSLGQDLYLIYKPLDIRLYLPGGRGQFFIVTSYDAIAIYLEYLLTVSWIDYRLRNAIKTNR